MVTEFCIFFGAGWLVLWHHPNWRNIYSVAGRPLLLSFDRRFHSRLVVQRSWWTEDFYVKLMLYIKWIYIIEHLYTRRTNVRHMYVRTFSWFWIKASLPYMESMEYSIIQYPMISSISFRWCKVWNTRSFFQAAKPNCFSLPFCILTINQAMD